MGTHTKYEGANLITTNKLNLIFKKFLKFPSVGVES